MAACDFTCSLIYKKNSQLVVSNYRRFKLNRQDLLSHSIDETLQLVSTVSRPSRKPTKKELCGTRDDTVAFT